MYFMQRDMSCVNLALCLPCPNLSVAYVKDRRLSGGPGTSYSPFTSDLLLLPCSMTLAFWNFFSFHLVMNTIFWAVMEFFFKLLLSFMVFFFVLFFFNPKDINPYFCFIKNNFSSHGKIYCPLFPSPHSFAIASPILLFAWPSASFEQSILELCNKPSCL